MTTICTKKLIEACNDARLNMRSENLHYVLQAVAVDMQMRDPDYLLEDFSEMMESSEDADVRKMLEWVGKAAWSFSQIADNLRPDDGANHLRITQATNFNLMCQVWRVLSCSRWSFGRLRLTAR